jgi:hypothetical protein
MSKKRILYLQFYSGELGKLEQRSCKRVAGDLADFHFVHFSELPQIQLNLMHDFDQVILGPAPFDFPDQVPTEVNSLVSEIIRLNYPTLGIGFGHLLLASQFGYDIKRDPDLAQVDEIIEYKARNTQSEIMPQFEIDMSDKNGVQKFFAYANLPEVVVNGDITKVLIRSYKNSFAAMNYTSRIFSIEFIPFLDELTYKWWKRPYPDFWKNLKGFWQFKRIRENTFFSRFINWFTFKYLYTANEREIELQYQAKLIAEWRDLIEPQQILRNFINKISKSSR